jgi:hypothetical protein
MRVPTKCSKDILHVLYCQESILAMVVFPRHKIIIYHEFGVLLACENVDKFIAVLWVGTR